MKRILMALLAVTTIYTANAQVSLSQLDNLNYFEQIELIEGTEKSYDNFATENSSDFIKTLKNVIKNPESVPESESDSISTRSNGKDYIIITHSDYDNEAAELAKWKQQLGYSVEIVSDNNWTTSEIKNEIHTRYHNWTA